MTEQWATWLSCKFSLDEQERDRAVDVVELCWTTVYYPTRG